MARKMLVNVAHPEEARVAIVEEGLLVELDVEVAGYEETRSNVYKGVVVRVEPGLQAAFVDIGLKKLGFLQLGEIHPDCWQWRDDVPPEQRHRRPRIQEILRRGQELIVQVEKGEREMKGAALTTYLSLPGRYMVLMPGSDSAGISRKVESESERKQLKEMAAELQVPEGYGYIMRTEALGRRKTELAKDLKALVQLSKEINKKGAAVKAPALIYQESDLVSRFLRDYFSSDIDEVLVDSQAAFDSARAFFKQTMPKFEGIVKLHQEKRPIFSKYQLEEQIDNIYEKKVPLKSGGSLVIDQTEALVAIDVNSGKSTGERNVEDTAFRTNMEAAEEVARQLRLRDLGGLIVVDFIDMRDKKHNTEVEKTLKLAMKKDKARNEVGKISQFGMLELSRQRIRQAITAGSSLVCPHCSGHGRVKSAENMALSFLRKVHAAACKGTVAEVHGGLPLEVAYFLLNRKKRELARLEEEYDILTTVKGKPSFTLNQMEIELVRREKPAQAATGEGTGEFAGNAEAKLASSDSETADGKKKRKRKRKKRAGEGGEPLEIDAQGVAEPEEEEADEESAAEPAESEAASEEAAEGDGAKKRKRKRRRKKKGSGAATGDGSEPTAEVTATAETLTDAAPEETPEATTEAPKRRKRKRRRGKGGATAEAGAEAPAATEVPAPAVAVASTTPVAADAAGEKPARSKRPSRKPAAAATAATEVTAAPVAPVAPVAAEAAPATARKSPAKKPATRKAAASAEASEAPAEPAAAKKTAARKAPAKKAVATPDEPATAAAEKKPRASRAKKPTPAAD